MKVRNGISHYDHCSYCCTSSYIGVPRPLLYTVLQALTSPSHVQLPDHTIASGSLPYVIDTYPFLDILIKEPNQSQRLLSHGKQSRLPIGLKTGLEDRSLALDILYDSSLELTLLVDTHIACKGGGWLPLGRLSGCGLD